jgi:predicted HAD superfamily Cof-like phosphohydrolase
VSYFADVVEWHKAAGIPLADKPTRLTSSRWLLRLDLMDEEWREFRDEAFVVNPSNMAGVAKEAADLIVTVLGTMAEMGIPFDTVWEAVHRSNMTKIGPNGSVVMREDGKILKPEGWCPPDIAGILISSPPAEVEWTGADEGEWRRRMDGYGIDTSENTFGSVL